MADVPENVKTRLQKLFALASDPNANEHMAAIASAKVQELLAVYNLQMAELSVSEGDTATGDAAREKLFCKIDPEQPWQVELLRAIASNNFCLGFKDHNRETLFHLVGRQINVRTTLHVFGYLVGTIERVNPCTDKRTKAHVSWKRGCADRLRNRLYDQRVASQNASKAAPQSRGDGSSLVLADVYSTEDDLNWDLSNGYEVGTTARNRMEREARLAAEREARKNAPVEPEQAKTAAERAREEAEMRRWRREYDRQQRKASAKVDWAAYNMGHEAGGSISLNKQVDADKRAAIA